MQHTDLGGCPAVRAEAKSCCGTSSASRPLIKTSKVPCWPVETEFGRGGWGVRGGTERRVCPCGDNGSRIRIWPVMVLSLPGSECDDQGFNLETSD